MMQEVDPKRYRIVSMMSGTSLDGVDLACCTFKRGPPAHQQLKWSYQLEHAQTYPYTPAVVQFIQQMQSSTTTFLQFKALELKYTQFLTQLIQLFICSYKIKEVDYLAIHGHTIFHRPYEKITVQITNLSYVAAVTHLNVIGNFRQLDVMRRGQGAPLAPYAEDIFQGDIFLNFGGIANLGYKGKGYDINYCNLIFNKYAQLIEGLDYDENGKIGKAGNLNCQILTYLNQNWKNTSALSLEREKAEELLAQLDTMFAHLQKKDHLNTFYFFLASEIIAAIKRLVEKQEEGFQKGKQLQVVCTGGGAKNQYLIQLLNKQTHEQFRFVKPSQSLIDFKEAILFGYLGVKFLQDIPNCSTGVGGVLVKGSK